MEFFYFSRVTSELTVKAKCECLERVVHAACAVLDLVDDEKLWSEERQRALKQILPDEMALS
jgi:hypothetical protein